MARNMYKRKTERCSTSGEKDRSRPFLSIQVYVVGLYIAVPDIATLQERLTRVLDPVATTLVPGERSQLKDILLDPEKSEEIWDQILRDGNLRTAIKIVPTRNTDLQHLRDGVCEGGLRRGRSIWRALTMGNQKGSLMMRLGQRWRNSRQSGVKQQRWH
jgi:hypothetical protein